MRLWHECPDTSAFEQLVKVANRSHVCSMLDHSVWSCDEMDRDQLEHSCKFGLESLPAEIEKVICSCLLCSDIEVATENETQGQ